ncbi:MAG: hypothetical protein FJ090_21225, partial [Deltaproteobacteria bacterium]|nr:hypothetical protein [Deltaproteobacteria bacterium]
TGGGDTGEDTGGGDTGEDTGGGDTGEDTGGGMDEEGLGGPLFGYRWGYWFDRVVDLFARLFGAE